MLTGSSGYDIPTQEVFEALPGMVNNTNFVSLTGGGYGFLEPRVLSFPFDQRPNVRSKAIVLREKCVIEHTWYIPEFKVLQSQVFLSTNAFQSLHTSLAFKRVCKDLSKSPSSSSNKQ